MIVHKADYFSATVSLDRAQVYAIMALIEQMQDIEVYESLAEAVRKLKVDCSGADIAAGLQQMHRVFPQLTGADRLPAEQQQPESKPVVN